ncbi:MAG TPA: hypothetical protein G4O08_04915 [Anaerolineae bacterium]|nr:hypothetical protein [Anaerolineae bacterium]
MKKIVIVCAAMIVGALLLQACGPSTPPEVPKPTSTAAPSLTPTAAPTPTATLPPPPATPPLIDMLTWLMNQSFSAAPEDFQAAAQADEVEPPIAVGDLPEGFIMSESRGYESYPQEGKSYTWTTTYQYPIDGIVSPENRVEISIKAYSNETSRGPAFEAMARARQAFLQRIDRYDVLSYYDHATAGHVWISGPFVIIVRTANPSDGSPNPWLSVFSEFMVTLYPPDTN